MVPFQVTSWKNNYFIFKGVRNAILIVKFFMPKFKVFFI